MSEKKISRKLIPAKISSLKVDLYFIEGEAKDAQLYLVKTYILKYIYTLNIQKLQIYFRQIKRVSELISLSGSFLVC